MNITKRMLRFGVAALAMAIGSQALAAGPIISESFEGRANGTLATNLPGWSTTDNNLSVVTTNGYDYTATTRPLTNSVTPTNVLQLVEGGMLSFTNGAANNFWVTYGTVYVDAMVKFVLSDGAPAESSIPPDTKIAIFANSSSNLVIRHGVAAGVTNSVTDTVIDPEAWYRLTVDMIADDAVPYVRAQVRVNSNIVTHTNADGDTLFRSALESGDDSDTILTAVSFQGSGFIDDVVVTRDPPTFVATASVFSYVIEEQTNGVPVAYILVASTNDFATGWVKTYAVPSNAWFTNTPVLGDGTEAVFTLNGRTVTSPAPSVVHNNTNYVLKVLLEDRAKGTNDLPARFAGMSSNEIARIRGYGNLPDVPFNTGDNTLAFEQAMKLNPYVNEAVTNVITSLTVGTPNSTIIVKVTTNGVAYASANDLTLNVLIDAKASLTNDWPTAAGITNELKYLNVLGETNITFATSSGKFFRTRIVPQQ